MVVVAVSIYVSSTQLCSVLGFLNCCKPCEWWFWPPRPVFCWMAPPEKESKEEKKREKMTTTRTEAVNHFIGSCGPPLSRRHSWITWCASCSLFFLCVCVSFADYFVRIETNDDDETQVQSSRALLLSSSDIGPEQWRVSVRSFSNLPGVPSDRNADAGPLLRFSTCVFFLFLLYLSDLSIDNVMLVDAWASQPRQSTRQHFSCICFYFFFFGLNQEKISWQ